MGLVIGKPVSRYLNSNITKTLQLKMRDLMETTMDTQE
jgi:hypothetical protein